MRTIVILTVALILGLSAACFAQTTAPAGGDDVSALKQKIKELEQRLDQVEAVKGDDHYRQIMREEMLKLLKDMKVEADKHSDLRVFWKDGVRMETADGAFKLHLGARLQDDWTWFQAHNFDTEDILGKKPTKVEDGTELRRVKLIFDGQIYDNVEFKTEFDFIGRSKVDNSSGKATQIDTPNPQDIYVRLTKIPLIGDLTAGHFKEPFSMEQLTSDANTTFMERSLADAFAPGFDSGFQAHNSFITDAAKVDRMTYAAGLFRSTDSYGFQQADGGYQGTFRLTGLPWYADNGKQLFHLGAAYSYRNPQQGVEFRAKPEDDMASYLVDSGLIDADKVNLFGGEMAAVIGPWHAEAELESASVESRQYGSNCFNGFYASSGYFITGESRPYNTKWGYWDRVRPNKNFREDGGLGAWEVAGRYSFIDLDDKANGGKMEDVTAGLNWYLNPNVKFMWNYVHSTEDSWNTSSDALMMRFQVDF